MIVKRFFILLTCLLSPALLYAQQDAQQSQYMFNGLYINPAYAGYQEKVNLQSFYRNQWAGIPGAPVTLSVALDASANDGNVGLALQLSSDKLGAQSYLSAYGNYAYRLRMNADGSSRLAFGIGFGVQQQSLNTSALEPNDPEPKQIAGTQSKLVPDARIGVYFSTDKFYAGVSADNLVASYLNFDDQPFLAKPKPHLYLTGGMLKRITEDLFFKPSILLKDEKDGPTSLDINSFLLFGEKLWIGGSYRTRVNLYNKSYVQNNINSPNSVVLMVQAFAVENLRIGYSYDFSVGPLQGSNGGTHELSVGYYFKARKTRLLTPRYF